MDSPSGQPSLPLLGVAALQLETRPVATAENLAHINALLDSECARLGILRWDEGGASRQPGKNGLHLDILLLPEVIAGMDTGTSTSQ